MSSLTIHAIRDAVRAHAEISRTDADAKLAAENAAAWAKTEARLVVDFGIPAGAAVPIFDATTRIWSGMLETGVVIAGITLRTEVRHDAARRTDENWLGRYLTLTRVGRFGRRRDVSAADLASMLDKAAAASR